MRIPPFRHSNVSDAGLFFSRSPPLFGAIGTSHTSNADILCRCSSGLSSEALEEFLSILRPSTALRFPPTSPVLRPTHGNTTGAYFPYRRPASTRLSPSMSADGLLADHTDSLDKENDAVGFPLKLWGSDHLGASVNDFTSAVIAQ